MQSSVHRWEARQMRRIEFLVGEPVMHHCLVDNSAALHLCHRTGPGKLTQDLVAQDELKVKAVF